MCEPSTMFAITAAAAALSMGGQMMAASQQQAAFKANNRALNDSIVWNYHLSQMRDQQAKAAASSEVSQVALEGMKARGAANAAAAAGGVEGSSVTALFDEFWANEGRTVSGINQQLEFDRQATFAERKSGQMSANNQLQRMRSELPDPTATFLGATARLVGDVGGAYYRYTTPDPTTGRRRFG